MSSEIEQVSALEAERYAAMASGDLGALERLLDDRLLYAHSNGGVDSKDSYLATIRSGSLRYLTIDHREIRATCTPHTVAVIGSMRAEVILRGEPKTIDNQHMVIWSRQDDRWALLAYFPSGAPAQPAD